MKTMMTMKPPDPKALALLHKHNPQNGAILLVKKKVKRLFRELKSGTKDKRRIKKPIRYSLSAADMMLSLDYYQELYEQEWDLYNGVGWGMRGRVKAVQALIEVLLANDDRRIAYPKMVRRFCDKYLAALEDHYT